MAIKEKSIPSPKEIKTSTQSFTEEELKNLIKIRDQVSQLTAQMGQLYINKIKLEEAEKTLRDELKTLEAKESSIAQTLSSKYGKGSIDLASGTFTPAE